MNLSRDKDNKNEIRLGKTVLSEDDLEFPVMYNGESFIFKYPTPVEKAVIENEIARKLNGFPRESFSVDHLTLIVATAYVEGMILHNKSPEWFDNAWTCYDEECIHALYAGYLRFRVELQKRFNRNGPEGGREGAKP